MKLNSQFSTIINHNQHVLWAVYLNLTTYIYDIYIHIPSYLISWWNELILLVYMCEKILLMPPYLLSS